jgi:hypothetical protein
MGVNVGKLAPSFELGVVDADPDGTVSGADNVLLGIEAAVAVDGIVAVSVWSGVAFPTGALHARPMAIKNETLRAKNRRFV